MRKKLLCCILIWTLAVQLWGCGKQDGETAGDSGAAGKENVGASVESGSPEGEDSNPEGAGSDPQEADLFLSLADMPWRDNSMDAYSAVVNMPLRYTEPEGAMPGGVSTYVLGNARGSVFKKQFFEQASDCWDEIRTVTDQGEDISFRLSFNENNRNQAWMAGGMAGSDHYMIMTVEPAQDADADVHNLYRFFETDENMQVLNSFYVDCLDGNKLDIPTQLQADAEGNVHMITSEFSDEVFQCRYYIVASDGAFLTEAGSWDTLFPEQLPELFLLYDGRVGMRFGDQLKCVDVESGKAEVLADIKPDCLCCTLWDEKTLLYANGTGLYRQGLSGGQPELLYTWSNHGIAASGIKAVQVTDSQGISLIYTDYRGANYLKLKPTAEEIEIQEIPFAVSSAASEKYRSAVVAFNKKYPAYRIRLETYGMNDTGLLTKLGAGKGPVLVDTSLVGFENNADWWEPLDEIFRQMKLDDELLPQALASGRIDDTLYGVVTDFSINTVVTFAEEPEEWDYETFLNCFDENDPSVKSVFNPLNGSSGDTFLITFFIQGLSDNYFFDAADCTTRFDSQEFRKILKLASLFMERERQGDCEAFRQRTSPCAVVYITNPADLACLRIWGGDKLRYIGYPSEEGSKHYISCSEPITIRANATAEEKLLARSFFQFLLSYDAHMETVLDTSNWYFNMSARRDVLEEQINRMDEYTYTNVNGFPQFYLEEQVDRDLDRETLYQLLEKAEPKQYLPRELSTIFWEEIGDYLAGNLAEDVLIDHLENRVELYLLEQK